MQTGYFSAAWHDIKNSPGWLGKLAVLGLVSLIPVFGWIVVFGYLLGWARDMAWGLHAPLPARVFGNEDGKLYSRGFFALVIAFVFMLVPWVLEMVWGFVTGFGASWAAGGRPFALFGLLSGLLSLAALAVTLIATLFSLVGSMRMSIYGRLAPGFQIGRIWAMMRHDFGGLARILAMAALLTVVVGVAASLLAFALALVIALVGIVVGAPLVHSNDVGMLYAAIPGTVVATIVLSLACYVVASMLSVFVFAAVARALGYWTRQFDVPAWRGQDDPMPFELAGGLYGGQTPPPGQPPVQR